MSRILFGILLIALSTFSLLGQKGDGHCRENDRKKNPDSEVKNEFAKWKRIVLGRISFCVPEQIKFAKVEGIDLSSWMHQDNNLEITVYQGSRSPGPGAFDQNRLGYIEREAWVNGLPAIIWTYTDKANDLPKVIGMRISREGRIDGDAATMIFRSRETDPKALAESIYATFELQSPAEKK